MPPGLDGRLKPKMKGVEAMRQLAIIGADRSSAGIAPGTEGIFELEGIPVRVGIIESDAPEFDPGTAENADMVQFKVKAFSCNYRDRALILNAATSERRKGYYVVASDFVGEVIAVGSGVTDLFPGDRVIADNDYSSLQPVNGVNPGIPTNQGSREIQVLHRTKLMKVPTGLSDAAAGSFSIGGQTAYSMVRKLNIQPGERVLVTGAKSNTSLFVIAALQHRNVEVVGLSTSDRHSDRLKALGLSELIVTDPSDTGWSVSGPVGDHVKEKGTFDAVIDPFSDVYMPGLFALMGFGSRYTTCGVADQHTHLVGKEPLGNTVEVGQFTRSMLVFNISLIGNCLGLRKDLQAAVDDAEAGRFAVDQLATTVVDTPKVFFEKTYTDRDRFGKVTYVYD